MTILNCCPYYAFFVLVWLSHGMILSGFEITKVHWSWYDLQGFCIPTSTSIFSPNLWSDLYILSWSLLWDLWFDHCIRDRSLLLVHQLDARQMIIHSFQLIGWTFKFVRTVLLLALNFQLTSDCFVETFKSSNQKAWKLLMNYHVPYILYQSYKTPKKFHV